MRHFLVLFLYQIPQTFQEIFLYLHKDLTAADVFHVFRSLFAAQKCYCDSVETMESTRINEIYIYIGNCSGI